MSRSYWLPIFATIGLSLWGETPCAQVVPAPSPAPKEETKNPTDCNHQQHSGVPVIIIETPEQAKARESAEKESRDHETEDLKAQIKAADAGDRAATATEWQIIPTWLGAILSFMGTLLILWTLLLTRNANAIAKETAKRQLRAYVYISSSHITLKTGIVARIMLTVRNYGQTPAKKVKFYGRFFVAELDESKVDFPNDDTVDPSEGINDYAPQADTKIIFNGSSIVPNKAINSLRQRTHCFYFNGRIEYLDVFGERHTYYFRRCCNEIPIIFDGDDLSLAPQKAVLPMEISKQGNYSVDHEN